MKVLNNWGTAHFPPLPAKHGERGQWSARGKLGLNEKLGSF
jgi:hypothetical protein